MNILIIGGTGLISTAITRRLLERGAQVTHFNRGERAGTPDDVQQIIGDRTDHAAFEAQMRAAGTFDCVIDMVGYDPEDGHSDVRAFAGRTGHLIFCSTVDVYARPAPRLPVRADAPRGGRNTYGRNKVLCEQILQEAHERGDFPVTVLRPAHTYNDGGALIHSFGGGTYFVDRLRKNKPIIVHGDGQSLWCLAHADDVGPAFAHAAGDTKTFGKAYNVTGEEWLTWDEMYRKTAAVLGTPAPALIHIPSGLLARAVPQWGGILTENFQFPNIFDNGPARMELAYCYSVDFEQAVRRIVNTWDAKHEIQNSDEQEVYDRLIALWHTFDEQVENARENP